MLPTSFDPAAVSIERHRPSVTQGEVSVSHRGDLLGRFGDNIQLCTSDHNAHPSGTVCFGGWHGHGDQHWIGVAAAFVARRALLPRVTPDTVVAGRRLADYQLSTDNLSHSHGLDVIVGHVVRKTINSDGEVLWHDDTHKRCGTDVAAVEGAGRYGDTFATRDHYRTGRGYAVVDHLYSCGCRS